MVTDGARGAAPVTADGDMVWITVWVVPGARRTEITGLHGDAVRIRVAQPPERGRANEAVVRLLEERLGRRVELVAGAGARRKRFGVAGARIADVRQALGLEAAPEARG